MPTKKSIFLIYPGWTAGLFTLLCLIAWRWWSGFNGLYGQDSYAYLEFGKGLQDWMAGGEVPGDFFWPGGYPMTGALLGYVVGDLTLAFQMVSMLSMALTVGLLTAIGVRTLLPVRGTFSVGGRTLPSGERILPAATRTLPTGVVILVVLACIAFSPYLIRSGLACMSDALAVAVLTGVLFAGQQYRNKSKGLWLVLMIFLVAFGTWVRYPLGILLLGIVLIHLRSALKNGHYGALLGGVLLGFTILILHLKLEPIGMPKHHFLEVWSPANWFSRSFVMEDGAFSYRFPNLVFAFGPYYHPGYLGLATLALPFTLIWWRKLSSTTKAYAVLSGLYILFIAGIPFQNTRFLVVLIPLLLLNFFSDNGLINRWLSRVRKGVIFVLCGILLLNIGIVYYANAGFWKSALQERTIAMTIGEQFGGQPGEQFETEPGEQFETEPGVRSDERGRGRVFTFGMDGALRYYLPEFEVVNLWNESVSTVEWVNLHQPVAGDLVLFNESRFAKQWAGKSPVLNWEYLNQTYQLDSLVIFEGGWTLHELH